MDLALAQGGSHIPIKLGEPVMPVHPVLRLGTRRLLAGILVVWVLVEVGQEGQRMSLQGQVTFVTLEVLTGTCT